MDDCASATMFSFLVSHCDLEVMVAFIFGGNMTTKFDDKARAELDDSQLFNGVDNSKFKPRDMIVRKVKVKDVRGYIAKYHYSQRMPDSTSECYVGFYDNILAGICTFGVGSSKNQYTHLIPDIQDGEYRELTRLWSPDGMPRNTESKLISTPIKMLSDKVKLLVSFADPSEKHIGYVYQATNWLYCGMSSKGKSMVDNKGNKLKTNLVSVYRMRHPEYSNLTSREIMKIYNWKLIESSGKHRYVYLRGRDRKRLYNIIKNKIVDYPKMMVVT